MNDLDEQFGSLRAEVESRCRPDLSDIIDRKDRRRRNRAVAVGAAALLIVGGAVLTVPQFVDGPQTTASGVGDGGADRRDATDAPESVPGGPVPESSTELIRLDTVATSLPTAADLDAIGETGAEQLSTNDGSALPNGCGQPAPFADPPRSLGVQYEVGTDNLLLYAAEFPTAANAGAALDLLVTAAADCPGQVGTVTVSVASSTPGETALLTFAPSDPGATGSGAPSGAVAVRRVANVVLQYGVVTVPGTGSTQTDPLPATADRASMGAAAMAAQLRDPEAD